jgi:signal transduction histidine kinase
MSGYDLATFALILFEFGLGLSVLFSNPKRTVNQCFCLLSFFTASWMLSLQIGFHCVSASRVEYIVRLCTVWGSFFPIGFNLLRLAIKKTDHSFRNIILESRIWIFIYLIVAAFSFTDWYLIRVDILDAHSAFGIPEPVYGKGYYLWAAYYTLSILTALAFYSRDVARARGRTRIDLQFVYYGLLFSVCMTIILEVLLPILRGDSKSVRLAPFCSVGLQTIIAYGIATKRALDVGSIVRRGIAYALLYALLTVQCVCVWYLSTWLFKYYDIVNPLFPMLCSAFSIAIAMGPYHNFAQSIVASIIGNRYGLEMGIVLKKTDRLLRSLTTTQEVLENFSYVLMNSLKTDSLTIYLLQKDIYVSEWTSLSKTPRHLSVTGPLVTALRYLGRPINAESLLIENGKISSDIIKEITDREALLALAIPSQQSISGIVLLGEKLSGGVYDESQQELLQIMVNRLGQALENAALYTEIQESKAHVETLIDRLLSGILVVNENKKITLINREAVRIMGEDRNLLGQEAYSLPEPIREAIMQTLESGEAQRDLSAVLQPDSEQPMPVRFGCGIFRAKEKMQKEVFVILDDVSQVKRLEEQLRRSDRLSSLGTLSASIAHEIKNPLVAIKTFVQLIPESKTDLQFLDNFGEIVGSEVNRIDNIVNQLLSFARTTKGILGEVHVHEVIESTLRLVQHDLLRKQIRYTKSFEANMDMVWADKYKLEQVILNIILNAQDAMPSGGTLRLSTQLREYGSANHSSDTSVTPQVSQPGLAILFEDDGSGFKPEVLHKAFDPFFTTKNSGTGLGLSIVYDIVTEHGGEIKLMNRPEGGACVQICLPLYMPESLAA